MGRLRLVKQIDAAGNLAPFAEPRIGNGLARAFANRAKLTPVNVPLKQSSNGQDAKQPD